MFKVTELEQVLPSADAGQSEPVTRALHLLHVEDNVSDALLMQEHIRGILQEVTFDTAARLVDVTPARAAAADCALLDLSLPDASGLDALQVLRGLSIDLPIIVLTGFDDLKLGLAAVRDGADDYLVKNHVDGYTLERAVQYAIERRRLMLQLAASTTAAGSPSGAAESKAPPKAHASAANGDQVYAAPTVQGTHQVSVRIDPESFDFVLECRSCSWVSRRQDHESHSWAGRALDVTLLQHVYCEGLANRDPEPAR
jgi:DNA-binding NarL/FixJ family response regulator